MAPHRYEDEYDYDSDDSTLVGSRMSRRRRRRYRSPSPSEDAHARPRYERRFPSPEAHSARGEEKSSSGYKTFGKVALGVVFVHTVATALGHWMKKKEEEREKEQAREARERRRRFDRAKAKRRREDDRREREQEERWQREEEEWEASEISEVRRIDYVPAVERSPSSSPERQPRRIEAAPEMPQDDEPFNDRRSRDRSRSRPAVDVV
ncbi:Hypothetical predicted protein [Lecanosticta acicola]|uniref:Uncharacterized protein n=1 Tax=Lecanosticta acicola TaxID=111012 RepID=A0AAI8Z7C2_9PEZI|nr:Hypothetical predicted protein [Lecanosticta acicola]